jgi:hypothetical protein
MLFDIKIEDYMLPCLSKKLFGIDCLGCGIQRSLVLLFEGKFQEAFYMYPAIYTMLLFFFFIGLQMIQKSKNYHKLIVTLGILTALIMIVSYFYKLAYY